MKFRIWITMMAVLALPAAVRAQHDHDHSHSDGGDIAITVENGRITTGAHYHGDPPDENNIRVFGYELEPDSFFADTGFNAYPNTGLVSGMPLRFNLTTGGAGYDFTLPTHLSYWDGSGDVNFGAAPNGHSLSLTYGSSELVAGNGTGLLDGFTIQTPGASGSIHRHFGNWLEGLGGADPLNGIYLIAMELYQEGLEKSLPFFWVYNNGLDEEVHHEALEFVEENYLTSSTAPVPEPGSLALLSSGAAAGLLAWRRRKKGPSTPVTSS